MPDLLTHVLVAYVIASLLSYRYDWLSPQFVTVAMLGAIVPDLTKIKLLVPSYTIEAWLGLPFDWFAVHTLGGALVAVTIGALATTDDHRRRVFALLLVGALSHLLLDGLLVKASGYAAPLLWPVTPIRPPTPGLFLSSDRWPALVAAVLAGFVWYARTRWRSRLDDPGRL